MHPQPIAYRNEQARRKIGAAADTLAAALGLPPLQQPTAVEMRQPPVAQMRELEHIAALLNCVDTFLKVAGFKQFSDIPANRYDDLDLLLTRKERQGK